MSHNNDTDTTGQQGGGQASAPNQPGQGGGGQASTPNQQGGGQQPAGGGQAGTQQQGAQQQGTQQQGAGAGGGAPQRNGGPQSLSERFTTGALRIGIVLVGFLLFLFALGQAVGLELLDMFVSAVTSQTGRWLVVAVFALLLIVAGQQGVKRSSWAD